jgi:C4-dicarboxylate-specific signal transduction histidine kinase
MELAHTNRVATMGQLTASIAHEVKQPISAAVASAKAALRFLARRPPKLGKVRETLEVIVETGHRTGDVVDRIRALIKKAPIRNERLAPRRSEAGMFGFPAAAASVGSQLRLVEMAGSEY